jgi:hypothetical protein
VGEFVGFFYEIEGFWSHFGDFLLFGWGEGYEVGFEQIGCFADFCPRLFQFVGWDAFGMFVGFHCWVLLWLRWFCFPDCFCHTKSLGKQDLMVCFQYPAKTERDSGRDR